MQISHVVIFMLKFEIHLLKDFYLVLLFRIKRRPLHFDNDIFGSLNQTLCPELDFAHPFGNWIYWI